MKKIEVSFIDTNDAGITKQPKKFMMKYVVAILFCTVSSIAEPSLAASNQNSLLWPSNTFRHEDTENNYVSILKFNLNFSVFNDVNSRDATDAAQPNYTKSVVIALVRWIFRKRSEREGNNTHIDAQIFMSRIRTLFNSVTPNKMAIIFAYVQNDISKGLNKSNNKALSMLDKAASAKEKKLDKEFVDRQEFIQMARLRQVEASMKQYAALNDKAYQLGFETFNRLKDIDENLNIPIYQKKAYKVGIERGRHNYDLSVAERRLENTAEIDKPDTSFDNGIIEADKRINKNEIKLN